MTASRTNKLPTMAVTARMESAVAAIMLKYDGAATSEHEFEPVKDIFLLWTFWTSLLMIQLLFINFISIKDAYSSVLKANSLYASVWSGINISKKSASIIKEFYSTFMDKKIAKFNSSSYFLWKIGLRILRKCNNQVFKLNMIIWVIHQKWKKLHPVMILKEVGLRALCS